MVNTPPLLPTHELPRRRRPYLSLACALAPLLLAPCLGMAAPADLECFELVQAEVAPPKVEETPGEIDESEATKADEAEDPEVQGNETSPGEPITPLPPLEPSTTLRATGQAESDLLFSAETPKQTTPDLGKFGIVLHGFARAGYDSNIFIQPDHEEEDFIFTIAPGVAAGWGDFKPEIFGVGSYYDRYEHERGPIQREGNFIFVDYLPSVTLFLDHSEEGSFDHDVTLKGQWAQSKLTLGIYARFQTLNMPDIEIGDRVEQKRLMASITSKYEFSDKTSVEANFFHFFRDYERNGDTTEWRNQDWFNYQVRPRLNVSLGVAFGLVNSSEGPSQVYEQALLRVRFRTSEKLTLNMVAGFEARQVDDTGDQYNPVFSLGATWLPFSGTYFYLNGFSRTLTSPSQGQNYTATGFDFAFRQRLWRRFYARFSSGYQNSEYDDLQGQINSGRSDDLFYVRPSLAVDITSWLSAELACEFRTNDSTRANRSFDEATILLQFNVLF